MTPYLVFLSSVITMKWRCVLYLLYYTDFYGSYCMLTSHDIDQADRGRESYRANSASAIDQQQQHKRNIPVNVKKGSFRVSEDAMWEFASVCMYCKRRSLSNTFSACMCVSVCVALLDAQCARMFFQVFFFLSVCIQYAWNANIVFFYVWLCVCASVCAFSTNSWIQNERWRPPTQCLRVSVKLNSRACLPTQIKGRLHHWNTQCEGVCLSWD